MATATQSQPSLLRQGADSYLDALAALQAFRQEVETVCRRAYETHEPDLLKWMGLGKSECELWDDPYPEDRYAELGIRKLAGKGTSGLYVYLAWKEGDSGAPEVQAAIDLDCYTKTLREKILEKMQKHPGCRAYAGQGNNWYVRLDAKVEPDRISTLGQILNKLLMEWVRYCKAAGGLRLAKM
jgi:hypothetical protein